MKHKFIKRSAASALTALMCAASIPAIPTAVFNTAYAASTGQTLSVGNGQNQHKEDNVDGYSYEIWLDTTGGSGSMSLGSGGTFNTEWSAQVSSGNFLARRGRNYDASKKATQYGNIVMDYAADYTASAQGNSRLCVYGWMKDPLVEYYIIEDWVNWCPSANGGSKTVTIDGAQYEIFQLDHTGPTILGDTRTFKQYFSVRKQKRTSGTITVSDHFKAWADAGWNIGNLTEVALNVEGWESSGKANVSKLTIGSEGSGSGFTAVETPQAGGNNSGFDMGNQGGFDWSNMGGNNGGFDMGNQGGFDWSNMSGNNGGFNMGNQGNIDWSGMAGGFNNTNNNIGSDAGNGGNAQSGLNAKIKGDMPTTVPAGAEKTGGCKVEKKTYNCKFTGGTKSCNVILHPNYNSSKKYPVMYVLHGIGGDENSMVSGMGVQELLTGLISSGQAEEMIIVLPSQFTSKNGNGGGFGIDQATCEAYDNFLYDISDSLIDFIEQNYSVKPGRENRAITGFSMGGREAIYIGLMRPDLFAYVGGACPAPGIVPGKDMFMEHPGCMTESEMKFRNVGPEPDVFMITGGTNDSVVGTFPSQYSEILTRNGVNHVYQSIPGGGHGADSVKPHLYTFMRYAFKGSAGASVSAPQQTTQAPVTQTPTTTTQAQQQNNEWNGWNIQPEQNNNWDQWSQQSGPNNDWNNQQQWNQQPQQNNQWDWQQQQPWNQLQWNQWNDWGQNQEWNQWNNNWDQWNNQQWDQWNSNNQWSQNVSMWGDANNSNSVDIADAVTIMQGIANPDKYGFDDQTLYNADVYQAGTGVTAQDATAIQRYLLQSSSQLPESYWGDWGNWTQSNSWDWNQWNQQGQQWDQPQQQQNNDWNNQNQWNQQQNFDWNNQNQWNQQQNFDWNNQNQWNQQQNFDQNSQNQQPAQTQTQTNVQVNQDLSGKKLVAISFDDGASATSRQDPAYRIMDALIKNNFHATFFYVGDWIKTNEQVQFAYKNGMEVANHTKSHPSLGSLGASEIRSEWEQCNSKLKSIIGAEPSHIMRLPYLDGGGQVKTALYDVPLISCGLDTQDWNGASADQIVNTIKSAAQNGTLQNQIVLCHENYAATAQAMETVLPWLKENGWEVVTVSEMFKANGKQLQGGQIYTRS